MRTGSATRAHGPHWSIVERSSAMGHISRSGALAAMGAVAASLPKLARAQGTPYKIRIGSLPADTYAEAYYALDLGLFDRAGLSVDIVPFKNGGAAAAAAVGGSIDIGIADASELANGINRGIPFVLIAGGGLYTSSTPTSTLCIAKTSPIVRASELEGQNVAVISLAGLMPSAVKNWLAQNGADIAKIHFVELSFPLMPSALERGTVAAACLSEPVMSAALGSTAKIFGKAYDSIASQFLISDWFTSRDWLANNPDVAKRFVGAIYEAARWANGHREQSAAILAKYAKMDVARLKHINRCTYATDLRPGLVQPVLDVALKYKSLETATNAASMIAKGFAA